MRYKKGIRSGVLRIPLELKEVFGDEVVIAPSFCAAAIYGSGEDKSRVIKSLQIVIQDLRQEIAFDVEREKGF